MTYRELYLKTKRDFAAAGVDSPSYDAMALIGFFFGLDRPGLALREQESPPVEQEAAFLKAAAERAGRRPLQYILGRWEFMGMSLCVGEGVLIPREDSVIAVEALAGKLSGKAAPVGLDLCAGSGAIALGLCSLIPKAAVTCIELSGQAFGYLEKNIAAHPFCHIQAKRGDILLRSTAEGFAPASLDFIVSNPPYIRTEELPSLQPEVQKEPVLALDGGQDGLTFYRAVAEHWLPLLKPGGVLAVEIGEEQGQTVSDLFASCGLKDVDRKRDWAGLDRCVIGSVPCRPQ